MIVAGFGIPPDLAYEVRYRLVSAHAMSITSPSTARVAIVDDDPHVRSLLRGLLVHTNGLPEPECYASPVAARQNLAASPPHLLFLDVRFKGQLTGLHLLSDLRAELDNTAVCIITIYSDPAAIFEAWRQGIAGYLHKPLDPRDFERAVPALLGGGMWFCPEAQTVILRRAHRPLPEVKGASQLPTFNETRKGILVCLAAGRSREDEIAPLLRCSEATVTNEISNLYSLLEKTAHHKLARRHRRNLSLWARSHIESLCARPIALPYDEGNPAAPPLLDTYQLLLEALDLRKSG